MRHQAARLVAVRAGNADRAEKLRVLRIGHQVATDALPQQQQRLKIALIVAGHERAAQLQRRPQRLQGAAPEAEQAGDVQAALAALGQHAIDRRQTIGAGKTPLRVVPQPQVQVVLIEVIQIERLAAALAGGPESQLALAADFLQHARNLRGRGQVHRIVALRQQAGAGRQAGDLGGQRLQRRSGGNLRPACSACPGWRADGASA